MKELFIKLSSQSSFFKENRLVAQFEKAAEKVSVPEPLETKEPYKKGSIGQLLEQEVADAKKKAKKAVTKMSEQITHKEGPPEPMKEPEEKYEKLEDYVRDLFDEKLESAMTDEEWGEVKKALDNSLTQGRQGEILNQMSQLNKPKNPFSATSGDMLFSALRKLQSADLSKVRTAQELSDLNAEKKKILEQISNNAKGIQAIRKGEKVTFGGKKVSTLDRMEVVETGKKTIRELKKYLQASQVYIKKLETAVRGLKNKEKIDPDKELPLLKKKDQELAKMAAQYVKGIRLMQQGKKVSFEGKQVTAENRKEMKIKILKKYHSFLTKRREIKQQMREMVILKKLPDLKAKRDQANAKLKNYVSGMRDLSEGKTVTFGGERVTSLSREAAEEMALLKRSELVESLKDANKQIKDLGGRATQENREEGRAAKGEMKEFLALLPKMIKYKPTSANKLAFNMKQARSEVRLRPEERVKVGAEMKMLEKLATPEQIEALYEKQNKLENRHAIRIHNQELADIAETMQQEGGQKVAREALSLFLEKEDRYFYVVAGLQKELNNVQYEAETALYNAESEEKELKTDQERLAEAIEENDGSPEDADYIASMKQIVQDLTESAQLARAEADAAEVNVQLASADLDRARITPRRAIATRR